MAGVNGRVTAAAVVPLLLVVSACTGGGADAERAAPSTSTPVAASGGGSAGGSGDGGGSGDAAADVVVVEYRVERRTTDPETENFEAVVHATLADPRGWSRAGFALVHRADAPHVVILAEGPEVDRLCRPYDTGGRFSCQIGPVVAVNADRWRSAYPKWTGDLDTYRQMLVNHEVGHLLGQHHPDVQCPEPGQAAPVMAQQTSELRGCLPNPWPLEWEVARASRHDLPLAPGYERRP